MTDPVARPARVAMTGTTGFVGGATLELALSKGLTVNALTRRPQLPRHGVHWVHGTLDDPASLDALVKDTDAVLHIAGVVNAPDRAGFQAGNADGTRHILDATQRAGVRRFVHVSSLAAREPALSDYGWSKERAEAHVIASPLDWTIIRPPAIYGPGDREMLDLFKMAAKGIVMLPPGGHLSVIEVSDLARLLLALVGDSARSIGATYEADDGVPQGWSHKDFGRAIGQAMGRNAVPIATPRALLSLASRLDRLMRGKAAKLTADRVAYFCHPDWVANPALRPPAALWVPQIETRAGLQATARAYREKGWV